MQQCEMKTCLPATNLLGPLASPPFSPSVLHAACTTRSQSRNGENMAKRQIIHTCRRQRGRLWQRRRGRDVGRGYGATLVEDEPQFRKGTETRQELQIIAAILLSPSLPTSLFLSLYICLSALPLRLALIRCLFLFVSVSLGERAMQSKAFIGFHCSVQSFWRSFLPRCARFPPCVQCAGRFLPIAQKHTYIHTYVCTYTYTLHDSVSVLWTPFGWHVADLEPRKCTVGACECVCDAVQNRIRRQPT